MRAVDAIYDYYAEDLYDYCLTFLDQETAADALHDAMLVAVAWSGKLEARDQFGLWLFALTRNECLRVLRRGGAPPAAGAHSADISFGPTYSTDDDSAHGVLREVYDLVHRHAFDTREIAAVLGISAGRAQALCERSEQLFGGGRHVITPANARPRTPLPSDLRSRVVSSANLPSRVAYRGDLATPRLRNGYPVPLDRIDSYRRGRTAKASGAAAALLLVIGAAFMVPTTSRHNVVGLLGSSRPASDVVNSPVGGVNPTATPTAPAPSGTVSAPPPTWAPLDQPTAGKPTAGKPAARSGPITGVGGKCIEAVEGGGLSGGAVQLFRCTRAPGQRWTVATDGTLRTLGKCLHVSNGGTTDGTEIQLQACDGSGSQQWKHRTDGSLFNPQSKRCLEAPTLNASDTTQLVIWKCSKAENQLWSLPR